MQPFKAELLPLWRFKTEADAKKSAEAITARWRQYMDHDEFPGADLARKYLQMVGDGTLEHLPVIAAVHHCGR